MNLRQPSQGVEAEFSRQNLPFIRTHWLYDHVTSIGVYPLAAGLAIFFLPAIFVIAVAIKMGGGRGPVLYRQRRAGRGGRPFTLFKFRTMVLDAESDGPRWSSKNDPRVTKLGRFLRATHLDEIPQLWNVLRGEMRFVGPRPERPEYYELLKEALPKFHLRQLMWPGITGWAQINEGYASSVEESRQKLEADLYYAYNRSPLMDIEIMLRTLLKFFPMRHERRPSKWRWRMESSNEET